MELAVQKASAALKSIDSDSLYVTDLRSTLACGHQSLAIAENDGESGHLNLAITYSKLVLDSPYKALFGPMVGVVLSSCLLERYVKHWDKGDLHEAMELCKCCINANSENKPVRISEQKKLACLLVLKCLDPLSSQDVDAQLAQLDDLIRDFEPEGLDYLQLIFASCMVKGLWNKTSGIENVLELARNALQMAKESETNILSSYPMYCALLMRNFESINEVNDLTECIEKGMECIAAVPDSHQVYHAEICGLVSAAFRIRFELQRLPTDLDQSIAFAEKSLISMDPDSATLGSHTVFATAAYLQRCEITGTLSDARKAVDLGLKAHQHAGVQKSITATNLSVAFLLCFEQGQQKEDLEMAHLYALEAIDLTPERTVQYSTVASNAFSVFHRMYGETKSIDDLNEVLKYGEAALKAVRMANTLMYVTVGFKVTMGLLSRYYLTNAEDDVEKAILCYQNALEQKPTEVPLQPEMHYDVVYILLERYRSTKRLEDLDKFIHICAMAEEMYFPVGSEEAMRIMGLWWQGLKRRYRERGNQVDADEIQRLQKQLWLVATETELSDLSASIDKKFAAMLVEGEDREEDPPNGNTKMESDASTTST